MNRRFQRFQFQLKANDGLLALDTRARCEDMDVRIPRKIKKKLKKLIRRYNALHPNF